MGKAGVLLIQVVSNTGLSVSACIVQMVSSVGNKKDCLFQNYFSANAADSNGRRY